MTAIEDDIVSAAEPRTASRGGRWFWLLLAAGLVLRIVILTQTSGLGTPIVDEQHYRRLGSNILAGYGFAMEPGTPTSIRPPLYPALLAATWFVTGSESLQSIRVLQIVLGLATAGLVFLIGRRLYGPAVGRLAAAICWLYPSLVFSNYLILTETLFTFLLVAFVLLMVMLVESPRAVLALSGGAVLALAALTRSVLWPAPLVLCPLLFFLIPGTLRMRAMMPLLVLTAFVVVLAPWSVRNTRLQGVFTTVDTMGGLNLRMGNYEFTPEDRMWDAVSLTGERSWVYALSQEHVKGPLTEGFKDKWAQRKALEYMREHPGQTLRRSLIKFADFWGLERDFLAGVRDGFFAPPRWFGIVAALGIIGGYVVVSLLGAAGLWLERPRDWRTQLVLLFPVALITGAHTIVFGHSRYHLPLMPLVGIWAAALVAGRLSDVRFQPRVMVAGAAASVLLLCTIWVRQVVVVDATRIATLFRSAGL
jgi:4-amino-4-deoxy-L-arabinose transferase-like glycosyltransferase